MNKEKIYLWEDRKDVYLDLFVTNLDPMFPAVEKKLPAIIVCPGGTYIHWSAKNEGDGVAMQFAAVGYQVFVLKYTCGMDCGENSSQYPAQLLDMGKAILTIREHATEWFVDENRIAVMGFSAGAHLCATLATQWNP